MLTRPQLAICIRATVFALLLAPPARAESTTWTGGSGDWGTAANWSSGEPKSGVDARFDGTGTATVSQAGAVCGNLLLGVSGTVALNVVAGGTLAVGHRIALPVAGTGGVTQDGGSVTADSLVVGAAGGFGQYQLNEGTLTVNHATVGPNASLATSTAGAPVITVTHSLTIGAFSDMVASAGTLTVGTTSADSLVVFGAWQMTAPMTVTATNISLRKGSVISAFVGFFGLSPIVATGAARLGGTLKVRDFFAPDGTWELVRGNPLLGTFDAVELPSTGDWTWRLEGNSVYVTKGPVAVQPMTWSAIKAGAGR